MANVLFDKDEQLAALMISYRDYFAQVYESELLKIIHEAPLASDPHLQIEAAIKPLLDSWFEQDLKEVLPNIQRSVVFTQPDQTIQEWLHNLNDDQLLLSLALHAVAICDDAIPYAVLEKLYYAGSGMGDLLLDFCLSTDWAWQDETKDTFDPKLDERQQISCGFLKIMGKWQSKETLQKILSYFISFERPDERIAEAVGFYLIDIGPFAVDELLLTLAELLKQDPEKQLVHEYLLMALAAIGQTAKRDDIFSHLRKAMRTMENPLIAAASIGDYGDPRGIRVLRSWLEQELPQVAPVLYQEMAAAIEKLGGDLDGLAHPLFK